MLAWESRWATGREKRGPAQQLVVLVAQCLSPVGMRWRLATCGRSHVSASLHVDRAEQASRGRLSSHVLRPPSITETHTILIEPRTVAPACTSDAPAAVGSAPASSNTAIFRQASSALRADDHFHGRPPVLLKWLESCCHSLPGCIASSSLAGSVRNISDPPPPLGRTRMC